ncbi:MAG: EF-P beta-lysylation protein EpmB [Gammaproteobacteria bacterium]|jgi:EF-P beta-lysylation protein EpmB
MIPAASVPWQSDEWRAILKSAIRDGGELLRHLAIDQSDTVAASEFSVLVPSTFLHRIERSNLHDPLLRQVLATTAERDAHPEFVSDPLGERERSPIPGVIHKYAGRVLVTLTGACPIHCRYCFRRHFDYPTPSDALWQGALGYVAANSSISEVILSGGDPLTLSDERLERLLGDISAIDHVRRVRIHTRFPIAIPQRVTSPLLALLARQAPPPVMVVHANHPNELDDDVGVALRALRAASSQVLNQSVLLAGVNDDPRILAELCERLFELGVLPYYLHLLDRVHGAAHYDVPESTASQIHAELKRRLPGYLVPRLVRELPGAHAKTELPISLH